MSRKVISLVLLFGLLATITISTTTMYNIAFAQDEDEKEEEEQDSDTKDEEEEQEEAEDSDTKDEDKEEEAEEETEEQTEETPITNLTGNEILELLQPVVNPQPEITTTQAPQPEVAESAQPVVKEEQEEFNATCKCTTIKNNLNNNEEPQQDQQQQIPVTKTDIQDSKSFGEVVDPAYTNFYVVPNLLDTIINDKSFWSQAGKSGFYIKLDNILDSYQVCSMELNGVYQPKNTPFLLDIGVSKNYTGVIDQPTEQIKFDKCVKNMDEIYMIFDNPSNSFVSISEIKLFGSKLTATPTALPTTPTQAPPLLNQTPELPPPPQTENATKINIQDSNAEIDIKNSTVTFKFDPLTGIFKGAM